MNTLNLDNSSLSGISSGLDLTAGLNQSSKELGQADFIQLLLAQVKNQDPSKPLDPSQFMSQFTQFATVDGIQKLNTSFNLLADKLASDQALQAANLVGHDVLVAGDKGLLDVGGTIRGQVLLPQQATSVNLKIINAQGVQVRSLPLGGHDAGELQFQWDGFADDGSAALTGIYRVIAEALINGNPQALAVELETRVDSVRLNQNGSGTLLNLVSGESVPLSAVQQIK